MYIISVQTVISDQIFYGPFNNKIDANQWAMYYLCNSKYEIIELKATPQLPK